MRVMWFLSLVCIVECTPNPKEAICATRLDDDYQQGMLFLPKPSSIQATSSRIGCQCLYAMTAIGSESACILNSVYVSLSFDYEKLIPQSRLPHVHLCRGSPPKMASRFLDVPTLKTLFGALKEACMTLDVSNWPGSSLSAQPSDYRRLEKEPYH